MVEVVLSNLPAGVGEATVQAWNFEEGDAVQKGEEIVELSTEEGILTIAAPATGILAEVYYDEGELVERGEILCLIEDEESLEAEASEQEEE